MTVWRKSSYSGSGADCVEVGRGVGIRDSKKPTTHLPLSADAWSAFLKLAVNACLFSSTQPNPPVR